MTIFQKRVEWNWPRILLWVVFWIIGMATIIVLFSGCSAQPPEDTPMEEQTGYRIDENDLSTFKTTLPSGREVECLAVTYRGSAIQCWEIQE